MTTKNPWQNTGSTFLRKLWDKGYKAGQADDNKLKSTRISDLERQVAKHSEALAAAYDRGEQAAILSVVAKNEQIINLQEKNDNQREIIVKAGEQHDIDVIRLEQLSNGYKTGHQAGLKAGQDIAADVIKAKEKRAYSNGIAEGERRLEGLGSVGFDAGFIKGKEVGRDEGGTFDEGNEAGYTDGLAEGKRQADSLKYAEGWTDGLARRQSDRDRGILEGVRRGTLRLHPDNPYPETEMHSPSIRAAWEQGHVAGRVGYIDKHSVQRKEAQAYEEGQANGVGVDLATYNEDIEVAAATGHKNGYTEGLAAAHRELAPTMKDLRADNQKEYEAGIAQGRRDMALELSNKAAKGVANPLHETESYGSYGSYGREAWNAGYEQGVKATAGVIDAEGYIHEHSHKTGFNEGRNMAFDDMVQHFILYMQQAGVGSEDFAVCKLSQLAEMREAANKMRIIVDNGEDNSDYLTEIENILTRLEVIDR